MMDFLRRLVPLREPDATRAVAVLPSRFASESPLRTMIGEAPPARLPDDDETSLSPEATLAPSTGDALPTRSYPVTGVLPSHAAPRPFGIEPTRRDYAKATSPSDAPAKEPNNDVAEPRTFQDRHGANLECAKPARPELQGFVAALVASPSIQDVAAARTQARVTLPLSQAVLAQRTLQSRDESQVVHVTIGRIDVVANTAPAPAVSRSPPPRQATVTLADYLRGGNGSRQ